MLQNIISNLNDLFERSLFLGILLWILINLALLIMFLVLQKLKPENGILSGFITCLQVIIGTLFVGFAGGLIFQFLSVIFSFIWKRCWKIILVGGIILFLLFKK